MGTAPQTRDYQYNDPGKSTFTSQNYEYWSRYICLVVSESVPQCSTVFHALLQNRSKLWLTAARELGRNLLLFLRREPLESEGNNGKIRLSTLSWFRFCIFNGNQTFLPSFVLLYQKSCFAFRWKLRQKHETISFGLNQWLLGSLRE